MVTRSSHGGLCCGAGHIHGFGSDEDSDPSLIDMALATSPTGRHNNVMLNLDQMRTMPNVLKRLADRGFVLDGHFINNNHQSHVFSFSRCDRRQKFDKKTLESLGISWPGQIISEGLHGDLPPMPAARRLGGIVVGQRYRVTQPSHVHGGYPEVTVGLIGLCVDVSGNVSTYDWEFSDEVREKLAKEYPYARNRSSVYSRAMEPVDGKSETPVIPEMRHSVD